MDWEPAQEGAVPLREARESARTEMAMGGAGSTLTLDISTHLQHHISWAGNARLIIPMGQLGESGWRTAWSLGGEVCEGIGERQGMGMTRLFREWLGMANHCSESKELE